MIGDDEQTVIYRRPDPGGVDPAWPSERVHTYAPAELHEVRGASGGYAPPPTGNLWSDVPTQGWDAPTYAAPQPGPYAAPIEAPHAPASMFRDQAVHAYRRGAAMGSPLRIVPTWMVWSTRIIVLAVLVASAFAVLAKIGDYARGPAVIRVEGRQVIGSRSSGNVTAIEVQPGTRVEAGAVLLRLDDTTQQAELARVEREYDLLLARLLRDPRDMALRKQLASLDADKQLARARLDERTVIAETSGIVSDVRVRVGHHVNPGDALVAVDRIASAIVVVAMLPGHYRPRLGEDDTRLQLELEGFPKDRIDVTLRSMADEVVGPHEALRYLGKEQADAVELRGPVVVVEATVERSQFESDGELFRFYDGMQGSLEIEVDSDSIIESLLPAVDFLGWLER